MKPIAVAVIWLCLSSTGFAQKVGDTVFVIKEDAELKSGTTVLGKADAGRKLDVLRVSGDWLWVNHLGTKGWISRSDVASVDGAIEIYTQRIRAKPSALDYQLRSFAWAHKGELDIAISDMSEAIRLRPDTGLGFNSRGTLRHEKGDFDKAIADFDQAIRLDPKNSHAYNNRGRAFHNRGNAWGEKKDYDKAIADFDQTIRLNPKYAYAYDNRGRAWSAKGAYSKAIADYNEAIRLRPKFSYPYEVRGWLYATCPDAIYRNGKQAVKDATKACELTDWKDADNIDTLAAAYAENGDFTDAVKWQQKAIEMSSAEDKADMQERLALYKSGKPYRTEPKK